MRARRDDSGLTLVEVLVALAVGAVAAAVLFAVLLGGQGAFLKARAEAGVQGDARAVLRLMGAEIRAAGSDEAELGLPGGGLALATGDSLRLVSDRDADRSLEATEPPEDVLYVVDGARLVRDSGAGEVVLLEDLRGAAFTYLDGNGQPVPPGAGGRVDPEPVRAVGIALTLARPDGEAETLSSTVTLRNR